MSVVLTVGDRPIGVEELPELLARYQLLPRLAREIILENAVAAIDLSPEEREQTLGRVYQQLQITTEEQRQTLVNQSGMTVEQFEEYVLRDRKLEEFKRQTWNDQVEGHFLNSKDKLDQVIYSLIRTREPGIAQELFFRIQEKEATFEELARQYSEGSEAQTGGLIGPVELNVPHPQIVQILKSTAVGQLSPPMQIGDWWVIVRLEKYIASQLDDNLRQRLRNDLFQTWLNQQLQTQVTYLSPPTPPEPPRETVAPTDDPWTQDPVTPNP